MTQHATGAAERSPAIFWIPDDGGGVDISAPISFWGGCFTGATLAVQRVAPQSTPRVFPGANTVNAAFRRKDGDDELCSYILRNGATRRQYVDPSMLRVGVVDVCCCRTPDERTRCAGGRAPAPEHVERANVFWTDAHGRRQGRLVRRTGS